MKILISSSVPHLSYSKFDVGRSMFNVHFVSVFRVLVAELLWLNKYDTTILRSFYIFLKADFGKKQ